MAVINLLPKENELKELSIQFNEGNRLLGYHATILIPRDIDVPEVGYKLKPNYEEADKFDAYVSLQPNPKVSLLERLGWQVEHGSDAKPLLCYVAKYLQPLDEARDVMSKSKLIVPTQYTRIQLDYSYTDDCKDFIVSAVAANTFNPVYYILNIVPYRGETEINEIDNQDNNTKHINIEDIDIEPATDKRSKIAEEQKEETTTTDTSGTSTKKKSRFIDID